MALEQCFDTGEPWAQPKVPNYSKLAFVFIEI